MPDPLPSSRPGPRTASLSSTTTAPTPSDRHARAIARGNVLYHGIPGTAASLLVLLLIASGTASPAALLLTAAVAALFLHAAHRSSRSEIRIRPSGIAVRCGILRVRVLRIRWRDLRQATPGDRWRPVALLTGIRPLFLHTRRQRLHAGPYRRAAALARRLSVRRLS